MSFKSEMDRIHTKNIHQEPTYNIYIKNQIQDSLKLIKNLKRRLRILLEPRTYSPNFRKLRPKALCCILQSKWYAEEFKYTESSHDYCLDNIIWVDWYLVISLFSINFRKKKKLLQITTLMWRMGYQPSTTISFRFFFKSLYGRPSLPTPPVFRSHYKDNH